MKLKPSEKALIDSMIKCKALEGTLNVETDVVVTMMHALLLGKDFERWNDQESTRATIQSLEGNLRENDSPYKIHYIKNGSKYTLFGFSEPNVTHICFESDSTQRGHVITLQPKNIVLKMDIPLEEMVPSMEEFCERLWFELIQPTVKDICGKATNDGRVSSASSSVPNVDDNSEP